MSNSHYHPSQPGQYPAPHPIPPKPKMPRLAKALAWIVAVPVLLAGGCTAVVLAGGASEVADTNPVEGTSTYDPGIQTPPTAGKTRKPVEQAPSLLPRDGLLLVGKDVKPGTYQTTVQGDDYIPMCYWSRLKDIDGGPRSIIDNNVTSTPGAMVTLRIKATDYAVEIKCSGAKWARVGS